MGNQPGLFTDIYEIYKGQDWKDFVAYKVDNGNGTTSDDDLTNVGGSGRIVTEVVVELIPPTGATDGRSHISLSYTSSQVILTQTQTSWSVDKNTVNGYVSGAYQLRITLTWNDGLDEIVVQGPARVV